MDSIRVVLSIVVADNLELCQFDIATAFLNGTLQEEIFMQQPVGFEDPYRPHHVCQLHKSLYGLRQASCVWNSTFTDFLQHNKLKPTSKDPCVYVSNDQPRIILLIFVDDGLICCANPNRINYLLAQMNRVFQVKDDTPDVNIGLRIRRDRACHTLSLDQQLYNERQILKYGFSNAKTINILVDLNLILSWQMDPNSDKTEFFPFQESIGNLNFAQTCTWLDVAYALSVVSQFAQNPEPTHCTVVRKIFRYLKGTIDFGLCYSRTATPH
jgi:hypothetical protein